VNAITRVAKTHAVFGILVRHNYNLMAMRVYAAMCARNLKENSTNDEKTCSEAFARALDAEREEAIYVPHASNNRTTISAMHTYLSTIT